MNITENQRLWKSIEKMRDEFLDSFKDLIVSIVDGDKEICKFTIFFKNQFRSFKEDINV